MKKLTSAQLRALRLLAAGREPTEGLVGRSAHGGFFRTWYSLVSMHMNMYVRGTDRIREQYALEKTTRIAQAQGRFAQAQAEFDSAEGEIVTSGGQTL